MSNVYVGTVYQQIIRDVLDASRVDFEEGGVDEGVLDELERGWQKKLSSLGVAQFPWDPKPEPTPPSVMSNPPPVASNYHMDANPIAPPQSGFSMPTLPLVQGPSDNANGIRIKTEPGLENGSNLPFHNANNGKTAQERAAQNLQGMYGSRAAASISAIQSNLPQQGQQPGAQPQQQQLQQRPSSGQQANGRNQLTTPQYQQIMVDQTARQRAQVSGMGGGQTDGAGDYEIESAGILKRVDDRGQEVEVGRVEIDHMIRRKIEAMGRSMEGGGLMLPLKERKPSSKGKRRNTEASGNRRGNLGPQASMNAQPSAIPQYDGIDDDEEDDKTLVLKEEDDADAINSDLDDPDEGLNEEEDDDEALGHIMLCMYDKVQRVKNKWKCVMKDGVLTVNGKEYVFHKASGEYEW